MGFFVTGSAEMFVYSLFLSISVRKQPNCIGCKENKLVFKWQIICSATSFSATNDSVGRTFL